MLETQSRKTGIPMNTLIKDTFGPASIGLVSTLAKNLNQVADANKNLQGSTGGALGANFKDVTSQLNFQMKQIEIRLQNSATKFGLTLLPYVKDAANIITGSMDYLSKHPSTLKGMGQVFAAALAGALSLKVASIGVAIAEAFGVAVAGGTAAVIGAAVATGVLGALTAWNLGKPTQASFNKASAEWQKNKIAGGYDIAALTVNTLSSALNKINPFFSFAPIPTLPIIGPNPISTSAGGGRNYSPNSPGYPRGKSVVNVNVSHHGSMGK